MRFTKMHGAGNDYVYVNCFDERPPADIAATAIAMSDRHKGIGADGLILICPSEQADARMRMFNADGSEAEMCGNGIRCFAKYVYDHDICRQPALKVETGAGVLSLDLEIDQSRVQRVRVDMGEPILDARDIPTRLPGSPVIDAELPIADRVVRVTCVSMGNPHCVTYVEQLNDDDVLGMGPLIEVDDHFPNRVNVEFIQVGVVRAASNITILQEFPAGLCIDGGHSLGQVIGTRAMGLAIERSKGMGIACVGIRNGGHIGAHGNVAIMAAEQGMLGFLVTNGRPVLAPPGGKSGAVSSTPFAFGCPSGRRFPLVLVGARPGQPAHGFPV